MPLLAWRAVSSPTLHLLIREAPALLKLRFAPKAVPAGTKAYRHASPQVGQDTGWDCSEITILNYLVRYLLVIASFLATIHLRHLIEDKFLNNLHRSPRHPSRPSCITRVISLIIELEHMILTPKSLGTSFNDRPFTIPLI